MPPERDVLPYRSEAGEKLLCAFRVAKAVHAALAFPGRLVAVLRPVVQPGGRFDEHVLHADQLRNVSLCCRIAAQLVGDDFCAVPGLSAAHA
jgi:hypothetical protein